MMSRKTLHSLYFIFVGILIFPTKSFCTPIQINDFIKSHIGSQWTYHEFNSDEKKEMAFLGKTLVGGLSSTDISMAVLYVHQPPHTQNTFEFLHQLIRPRLTKPSQRVLSTGKGLKNSRFEYHEVQRSFGDRAIITGIYRISIEGQIVFIELETEKAIFQNSKDQFRQLIDSLTKK